MFESILGAVLAHKQIAIAAIAFSALAAYIVPGTMLPAAQADHRDINISEDILISCLPYCNIANEPEDIDVDSPPVHVQINFGFVPA